MLVTGKVLVKKLFENIVIIIVHKTIVEKYHLTNTSNNIVLKKCLHRF